MLNAVTVTNFKGESLRMELAKPELSGMAIYDITGIGGGKANINTSDMATRDGSIFNSARMTTRNIVLTLKLMRDPSVEENRLKAYRYFPIKKDVTLLFETDKRRSQITGYVESNEAQIFSSQETIQISVVCPDPSFYTTGGSESAFAGVDPLFEFPFSNESLTDPLIEFGVVRKDTRATIMYLGDVDAGITITIHALGPAGNITLYNIETSEKMSISTDKIQALTGRGFEAGDDIIISTFTGNKYVRLLRDGKYTNVISAIERDADWFKLTPGENLFAFSADRGEANLRVVFNYRNAYGGI